MIRLNLNHDVGFQSRRPSSEVYSRTFRRDEIILKPDLLGGIPEGKNTWQIVNEEISNGETESDSDEGELKVDSKSYGVNFSRTKSRDVEFHTPVCSETKCPSQSSGIPKLRISFAAKVGARQSGLGASQLTGSRKQLSVIIPKRVGVRTVEGNGEGTQVRPIRKCSLDGLDTFDTNYNCILKLSLSSFWSTDQL